MKFRRRQMIVDKGFQYKEIARAVLTTIIVANLVLLAAFVYFPYEFTAVLGPFTWLIGIMEVILVAVVFWVGLHASHRVAGPAFSLKRSLMRLGDGDLTVRSTLRKTDYFKDVSDSFNENVERLSALVEAARSDAEQLLESLPAESPSRKSAEALLGRLESLTSGRAAVGDKEPAPAGAASVDDVAAERLSTQGATTSS